MPQSVAARVFRQSALDRLSSPEQLDRLITLTKPRDWLAALALAVVIALGIVWSVYGAVPVRVVGHGIMIATGGRVLDASSGGDGTLTAITALVGSMVTRGQAVAQIDNKDLSQSLASAEAVVKERTAQYDALVVQAQADAAARGASLAARRQALEARAGDADARVVILDAEVEKEAAMYDRRLITWQVLNSSKQALATARQEATEARSQIVQLDGDDVGARNQREQQLRSALNAIAEARRQAESLSLQMQQRQAVLAPIDGRVTEWKAAPGSRVAAGQPILSIEGGVTGTELILYLPPDQGKEVAVGMKVWVSPSTVKREEFGTLIGAVAEVSDFPSTPQAMMAVLQNDRLVQAFAPAGAPFASRVVLKHDATTPSGYAWSNGKGPAVTLSSGTVAEGDVTVETRRPISYVIPWLKKITALEG
jgi:HlyD family secretion protein